jgi:hypothetical protein
VHNKIWDTSSRLNYSTYHDFVLNDCKLYSLKHKILILKTKTKYWIIRQKICTANAGLNPVLDHRCSCFSTPCNGRGTERYNNALTALLRCLPSCAIRISKISTIRRVKATKMKVNVSLCFFNWAPRFEGVLEEWRYSSTHSLTSALDEGESPPSRPGRFTPRERALGTHWIGGWVCSRAGLDAVVKRKISRSRREPNPRIQIVQPVA